MMHILLIYFIIIIYYSFLIKPFTELSSIELVKLGYILWSDNFKYVNSTINSICYTNNLLNQRKYKYRIDLIFIGYMRWLCNKPHLIKSVINDLNNDMANANALNCHLVLELNKKGKLIL